MNFMRWCLDGMKFTERKKLTDFIDFGSDSFLGRQKYLAGNQQIVRMSPQRFLDLAEPIPPDDAKRHKDLRTLIDSGKLEKFRDVPELLVRKMEDSDDFKVYGHDGRHRAMLLAEAGFKEIPVRIVNDTFNFTSPLEDWPKWLWCQNDRHADREQYRFPFPVSRQESGRKFSLSALGLR